LFPIRIGETILFSVAFFKASKTFLSSAAATDIFVGKEPEALSKIFWSEVRFIIVRLKIKNPAQKLSRGEIIKIFSNKR
jgi:hypothetical protein